MKLEKKCLILALAVAAALFGGCGERDDDDWERADRPLLEAEPLTVEYSEPVILESGEPEPVEQPLLSSIYASAKPGNLLQFGAYEQDNNLSNGAEPIEWVVLANEGDKILVLSKYVLAGKIEGYEDDWIEDAPRDAVTWAVSRERKWLNDSFYEEAFSEEERNCILESKITTPDTEGTWYGRSNQPFHTYGGSDTRDHLFLLSYEEFKKYVKPLRIEMAEPTAASGVRDSGYAEGMPSSEFAAWLLRSPGTPCHWEKDYAVTSTDYSVCFTNIGYDGDRYTEGYYSYVFQSGRANDLRGLRPAMWLKVK